MNQEKISGFWKKDSILNKVISLSSSLMMIFSFSIFPFSTAIAEGEQAVSDATSADLVEFISPSEDITSNETDVADTSSSEAVEIEIEAESDIVDETLIPTDLSIEIEEELETTNNDTVVVDDIENDPTKTVEVSDVDAVVVDGTDVVVEEEKEKANSSSSSNSDTILGVGLSYPELLRPASEAFVNGNNFTSNWTEVLGAGFYLYDIMHLDADSEPFGLAYFTQRVSAPETSFTQTILREGAYGWRVKTSRAGIESDWSPRRKITIDNTPPVINTRLPERLLIEGDVIDMSGEAVDNFNIDYVHLTGTPLEAGECVGDFRNIDTLYNEGDGTRFEWSYRKTVPFPPHGEYCIKATAVDKAGNRSSDISKIKFIGDKVDGIDGTEIDGNNDDSDNSGGGGGGGGSSSGGSSGGGGFLNLSSSNGGQVLGATASSCVYINDFLKIGLNNNPMEVLKLQLFLNVFQNEKLTASGIFDQATFDAVSRFQQKYHNEILAPWGHDSATGFVYILSKQTINEMVCSSFDFPLTSEELSEIASFKSESSGKLSGIGGPETFSGSVLGEIAEAQEIDGDIEVTTEGDEMTEDDAAMEGDENGEKDAEEGRIWLWILFLVVLAVLLYFALRKNPENN